jgi:ATP-dependent helicase HrpB
MSTLPIQHSLDELKLALAGANDVVLEAPPGAGKTTLVPLALLDQPWLAGRKILMLEPRRIAARSAAHRMASLRHETPGQTVGYRMRLETRVGPDTRIEVITEGILTRMLQNDPVLEGVGLVIFDEFHERSLDSDLALALTLKGRELFAEAAADSTPVKILLMSATLNSRAISGILPDAPIVTSEGRMYPVEIIHGRASQPGERIVDRVVSTVQTALMDNPNSSLLVFLPGQGEIHRATDTLSQWLIERRLKDIELHPLYGNLTLAEQRQAIAPSAESGKRKIVLATNIAETSLTIEGIDVVVDSGLAREPRFNPATGMTALHTVKISKSSSIQRAGRAGRLRPGRCYRLWSQQQQQQLADQSSAEILQADLAPLALQLLQWGIDDPAELVWLDPPPRGPWAQALDLLQALGAVEPKRSASVLTAHGEAMAALSLHPRLAHMLICGAAIGQAVQASNLAAVLSERDPFSQHDPDMSHRLDLLSGNTRCQRQHEGWLQRCRQLASQYQRQLQGLSIVRKLAEAPDEQLLPGYLLACAYPDRIARQRHSAGYQLANGRSASLTDNSALHGARWLAVAEVSSSAGARGEVIRSAAVLDEKLFEGLLADQVHEQERVEWDKSGGRFRAEARRCIGALILESRTLTEVPVEAKRAALLGLVRKEGLRKVLPWGDAQQQWCARVELLRAVYPNEGWPRVDDDGLLASAENWLGPFLDDIATLQDFRKLDLDMILGSMLDWNQQQALEQLAPLRLQVPSGARHKIDYSHMPPVLACKLQEMFGCETTPTIANGKVALLVHLLSPAGRPLQVTQDLAGFWRSSYHDVKKDMKGRYPKHPWPDDPLQALPTSRAKPRR